MKQVLATLSARNLRVAVIVAPWVLAALYLFILAANRYVAESVVAVRQNGSEMPAALNLTSIIGVTAPASRDEEMMLEAYILSTDMLRQLDKKLKLREHFSTPRADFIFRMRSGATQERFLKYFRNRVEVILEDDSGLLRIRTQGFTPAFAEALNREIISISERFINESSHRLAREQMAFAENELAKARQAVEQAKSSLVGFQKRNGILDPLAQAAANAGLTAELQATLARQEAELKGLLGYLNPDASQIRSLQSQIAGTRAQLQTESRRGITSAQGASLNVLAGDYQELMAQLQFAQDAYKLALTGVETARVESTRKLKSLVLVQSPVRPESAEQPRRVYVLFALLLGLTLLYGITRLVVATIEDHQE